MVCYTVELTQLNEQVVDIAKSFKNQKTLGFFCFLQANYYIISSTWLDPHNLGWIQCINSRHRLREQPENWRIELFCGIYWRLFSIMLKSSAIQRTHHVLPTIRYILTYLTPHNQTDISVFSVFLFFCISMLIIKMIRIYPSLKQNS